MKNPTPKKKTHSLKRFLPTTSSLPWHHPTTKNQIRRVPPPPNGKDFNLALGLHTCGLLADAILALARKRRSSVCLVPCCYGQVPVLVWDMCCGYFFMGKCDVLGVEVKLLRFFSTSPGLNMGPGTCALVLNKDLYTPSMRVHFLASYVSLLECTQNGNICPGKTTQTFCFLASKMIE